MPIHCTSYWGRAMIYTSITDVRNHIDQIDSELVTLIAQRAQCVKAAAAFKTVRASVRAPDQSTTSYLPGS